MIVASGKSVGWRFWLIVIIGLIFNLLGCMNFLMQMDADSVASMPDVYRMMIETRPAWGTAAFAVAVFGGALGCVVLLLRKPLAFYLLAASLVGAFVAQLPYLGMANLPSEAWIGWLAQIAIGTFLVWFAWRSTR